MTERSATVSLAPRRAVSIRAIIISIAAIAFGFILVTGVAIALRVVPRASAIAARGAIARDDYTARTKLAAQLDSAITDLWTVLRQSRIHRVNADSVAVRRKHVEDILRGAGAIRPFRSNLANTKEFATSLEYADGATSRVAAALLGALAAIETGDVHTTEILMSRADSLDAPLTDRLNQVTEIALADLAVAEKNLEGEARFATWLLTVLLLVFVIASPLLWRLLQRRLVQPLHNFDTALNRVEAGDLDIEIPVTFDDELGRLGAHFNRTTQVLRTQRAAGERAAAQSALEASEARYRAAFEEAAIGLAEIALDGTLLRINKTMGIIFGRDPDAIVGSQFTQFVHPEDVQLIVDGWSHVARGEAPVTRIERRFIKADGTVAIAHATASLLRHSDGTPRHVLVVLSDATEQRRLERELMQATKLEAIGQLAGGVAHDFNNLLGGIIGYAELLEEDNTNSSAVREDAASIRQAAVKGADLARSLLALARRSTHREEPFALDAVIQETVDLVRRTFDRRVQVELVMDDAPIILGDRTLIANALLNLAVNARDAMPDGGVLRIVAGVQKVDAEFRLRNELPPHVPVATIQVNDNGVGMPPQVLARVFEPFFTTKEPDKGTGLGLAMAYGTVKDHGGTITVDSTVGVGTTVTLYLPCSDVIDVVATTASAPVLARTPSRILVVDDEPLIRSVATRMLQRLGYEVESAEDGIAAIDRLHADTHSIDLVIIDGNMPRLNGIETARRIHARHPELPMIFATGHFDPDGDEALSDVGFRERIEKPYSFETLSSVVARYLDVGNTQSQDAKSD